MGANASAWLLRLAGASVGALALASCGLFLDYDDYRAGGAAGAPSTTSAGASGGSGGQPASCADDVECGEPNECGTPRCDEGFCGFEFAAGKMAGSVLAGMQQDGDCKTLVCGDDGAIVEEIDDADVPVDERPCTQDLCSNGTPSNPPEPSGTPCGVGGMLACNDSGQCAGCSDGSECGAEASCFTWTCANQTCSEDPKPEGADCGVCKVCQASACVTASDGAIDGDCAPGDQCSGGLCQCENFIHDGQETALDCGGPVCAEKCAQGETCAMDLDCATGHCADGFCCDANCGGTCMACAQSKTGQASGTCAPVLTNTDPDSECNAPAADICNGAGACQCEDGIANGGEIVADCGGSCAPCGAWNCSGCQNATSGGACSNGCPDQLAMCGSQANQPCKLGSPPLIYTAYLSGQENQACVNQGLDTCNYKACYCQ